MIAFGIGLLTAAIVLFVPAAGAWPRVAPRHWMQLLAVALVLAMLGLLALGAGYIRA